MTVNPAQEDHSATYEYAKNVTFDPASSGSASSGGTATVKKQNASLSGGNSDTLEGSIAEITSSLSGGNVQFTVKPMVEGKGWDFDILLDVNSDLKRAMNVSNPPHTFLFDGSGKLVYQHTGYIEGGEEDLYEEIQKVAKKKK